MKIGDKVVFRKLGWFFYKRGTIIGINDKARTVAVKRPFRVYIVSLHEFIVVYKENKRK